ncbi:hypothetical protein EOD40_11140 [Flavobacterium sufflavum]|uniref:Uncharacterized protein n=1 Tax=Flavobacterium sufflavum TaxID=1921138 RepID=A0A437KT58_9FLAO|nr:hypothetical protein [Flavobacterium sufflavum]RVT75315.1 hypothetical protein EOD40_11140 [Flavobacterium sufflavum]
MNYKYLLEMYDTLISEIQSPKMYATEQITTLLYNIVPQSYFIYQIDFVKINNKFQFKTTTAIHNLHPHAPAFKKIQSEPSKELLKWLPKIEKQLGIQYKNKSYVWEKDNPNQYIIVSCKLEELSRENLFFFYCNWSLKNELELTKRRIKEIISKLNTKELIHDFIHKKQSNIECFLNKLIRKINPETVESLYEFSTNDLEKDCFKLSYIYLEKLMCYIEKDYSKYLNKNCSVPLITLIETRDKIYDKYKEIKSGSTDLQLEPKLITLIDESLSKIIQLQLSQAITYNEVFYSIAFTTKLHDFIKNKKEQKLKIELKDYLLMLNFNSLDFFDYYTDRINKELDKEETEIEKIKLLYKFLKNTNQKYLVIDNKYHNKLPSAKKQITTWIEEEIYYLNQKRMLLPYTAPHTENKKNEGKLLTGFSVPQLSYFFGLLIQTGIIQPKTQRAIFRFIAKHFKTKMTDTISIDSLNSKYYNVETTTKNAVREKIIELLNLSKF